MYKTMNLKGFLLILGIMLLLCMPFVYPSMNRCIAETTEEEK